MSLSPQNDPAVKPVPIRPQKPQEPKPVSGHPANGNSEALMDMPAPPHVPKVRGKTTNIGIDKPYTPAPALIRDTIPATGVGFLGGQSGAYKSFMMLELAFCIEAGTDFAGRKVEGSGGVAIYAAEGAGTLEGRIKARRSRMPEGEQARDLNIHDITGFGPLVSTNDYLDLQATLIDRNKASVAMTGEPLRCVFIDTLSAAGMIPADKENDAGSWQHIFDHLQPISADLGCPIILVHHYGKSADAGLRGSSNARAGADFALALTCERDQVTGETTNHFLALAKSRDAPEGPIGAVKSDVVEIGAHPDGEPITSLVLSVDTDTKRLVKTKRKPSRARMAFDEALTEKMILEGEMVRILGEPNGQEVKAVRLASVKDEFVSSYATGDSDPKKAKDTKRQQWKAGFNHAVSSGDVVCREWGGTEWIWRLNEIAE